MKPALFISDLHLDEIRPAVTYLFIQLLEDSASQVDSLFILGDLFEAWVGDDDDSLLANQVRNALHTFTASGTRTFFVRGNRDFLVGERFAEETGVEILADETVINLAGKATLIMHGDLLCTDDDAYQAFRMMVHDQAWQEQFLARDLADRRDFARQARSESAAHTANQEESIMDVNADTVAKYMQRHDAEILIHGHTHRPAIHELDNGAAHKRIVLGDWYEQGSRLLVDANGYDLASIPLPSGT